MINTPYENRRFRHIESGVILGIYDRNRSWTKYAPIIDNNKLDIDNVRTYFDDEVEEI